MYTYSITYSVTYSNKIMKCMLTVLHIFIFLLSNIWLLSVIFYLDCARFDATFEIRNNLRSSITIKTTKDNPAPAKGLTDF